MKTEDHLGELPCVFQKGTAIAWRGSSTSDDLLFIPSSPPRVENFSKFSSKSFFCIFSFGDSCCNYSLKPVTREHQEVRKFNNILSGNNILCLKVSENFPPKILPFLTLFPSIFQNLPLLPPPLFLLVEFLAAAETHFVISLKLISFNKQAVPE